MRFERVVIRRIPSLGVAAMLAGCTSDRATDDLTAAPRASVRGAVAASPDFVFEGDISMRSEADPTFRLPEASRARLGQPAAGLAGSPPEYLEQRFDYHLSYVDSGGRIIVEMTPPPDRASGTGARARLGASIWSNLGRIRFASDEEAATVTLVSGRKVVVDGRFIEAIVGAEAGQRARASSIAETPAARSRRLQGMIVPFIRIRPGSALRHTAFDASARHSDRDSSESLRSTWIRTSGEFDVAARRVVTRPEGKPGRMRTLSVELSNAKIAGVPVPLP
jgi:hypothetical protein